MSRIFRILAFFLGLAPVFWAKTLVAKKNKTNAEAARFSGIYMICDFRFFSFLDIKRSGHFLWEYHDPEGRIFQSKGFWEYLQADNKIFLNPELKLQKEIQVQALAGEFSQQRKLVFFLNGKPMQPNTRTKFSINGGAWHAFPDNLQVNFEAPLQTLAVEYTPGLRAQIAITEDAPLYHVYLTVPKPEEILLRNVALIPLEFSWVIDQNPEYPDLFFYRQINTTQRFFLTTSKDMNNCERNMHRMPTQDAGTSNVGPR